MKRTISVVCACMMIAVALFLPFDFTQTVSGEIEHSYPSSVSVAYGTSSGLVDDTVGQDGVSFSVQEIDTDPGRTYLNTTINPNGVGTYTEWSSTVPPATPHWQCVDEGSPGDGDVSYVQDLHAVQTTDTYNLQDYALASGYTIDEIRVYNTAKDFVPGTIDEIAIDIYSGMTLSRAVQYGLTANWAEHTNTWVTDPNTGIAWTEPSIDALEAGADRKGSGTADEIGLTLVYVIVQSSAPIVSYRAQFTFDFGNIDFRAHPQLVVSGYRTGDLENIIVQVDRVGTWVTLDANAFDTTLITQKYSLSTNDVKDGAASVRILDADNTDDTQTTIFIDEIMILTEGGGGSPQAHVNVFTHSEYRMWENRLRVELTWTQSGGPEHANVISRFLSVRIDGAELRGGFIAMPPDRNHTYLEVPWNFFDAYQHNITVFGYVVCNWSAGTQTYRSEPENLVADNWIRFVFLCMLFLILVVAVVAVIVHYSRGKYQERPVEEGDD